MRRLRESWPRRRKDFKVWAAADLELADNAVGKAGAMYEVKEILIPERKAKWKPSGTPEEAAAAPSKTSKGSQGNLNDLCYRRAQGQQTQTDHLRTIGFRAANRTRFRPADNGCVGLRSVGLADQLRVEKMIVFSLPNTSKSPNTILIMSRF
jgi:hypothetical protein